MAQPTVEGSTKFYIGVNVTADELSTWSPQKMAQFFGGIAKIVRATDDRQWPKLRYSARREGLVEIKE